MGIQSKRQSTVAQLIQHLLKLPPKAAWYGFTDETIIVEDPKDVTHFWVIDPSEDDPDGV